MAINYSLVHPGAPGSYSVAPPARSATLRPLASTSPASLAPVAGVAVAMILAKSRLGWGLYWGDFFFLASAVIAGAQVSVARGRVLIPSYIKAAFLFVWVAAAGSLDVLLAGSLDSGLGTASSLARILLFLICTPFLWSHALRLARPSITQTITRCFVINACIGLILYAVWVVSPQISIDITGLFGHARPSNPAGVTISSSTDIPRARGIMAEPASYGAVQAFALFWLTGKGRRTRVARLLIMASIAVTLSLTAIILGLVALVSARYASTNEPSSTRSSGIQTSQNARRRLRVARYMSAVAVGLVLTTFVAPAGSAWRSSVASRAGAVLAGEDQSASSRVVMSWISAMAGVESNPLFGSGLGNLGHLAFSRYPELTGRGLTRDHFSWNAFALVLGSTGIIGLFAWVGMIRRFFQQVSFGTVFICIWMFGSSSILDATVWSMMILLSIGALRPRAGPGSDARSMAPAVGFEQASSSPGTNAR